MRPCARLATADAARALASCTTATAGGPAARRAGTTGGGVVDDAVPRHAYDGVNDSSGTAETGEPPADDGVE